MVTGGGRLERGCLAWCSGRLAGLGSQPQPGYFFLHSSKNIARKATYRILQDLLPAVRADIDIMLAVRIACGEFLCDYIVGTCSIASACSPCRKALNCVNTCQK